MFLVSLGTFADLSLVVAVRAHQIAEKCPEGQGSRSGLRTGLFCSRSHHSSRAIGFEAGAGVSEATSCKTSADVGPHRMQSRASMSDSRIAESRVDFLVRLEEMPDDENESSRGHHKKMVRCD
jgi:hypothetical protein